ncbi:hypothetical protein LCGC14_2574790 [marine sediment metagenome]|uniref:Uncharacterized protein n=1 Tax=marine sediment metagenome TaxID=412755 RepID=A0A0F9CSD1_9ZZZZ
MNATNIAAAAAGFFVIYFVVLPAVQVFVHLAGILNSI